MTLINLFLLASPHYLVHALQPKLFRPVSRSSLKNYRPIIFMPVTSRVHIASHLWSGMCIFGGGWGRVAVEIEDAGLDAVKVPNHIKVSLVLFSAVTLPRGWQWQLDHRELFQKWGYLWSQAYAAQSCGGTGNLELPIPLTRNFDTRKNRNSLFLKKNEPKIEKAALTPRTLSNGNGRPSIPPAYYKWRSIEVDPSGAGEAELPETAYGVRDYCRFLSRHSET
ncbi:unnamed protein product, partial [Nesidiocoris tenuis]